MFTDCPANPIGAQNCFHNDDVGVMCAGTTCTQGAIRLQGGTATGGRVEICYNNIWGTVCDDFFDAVDTQVACRQLGLPVAGKIIMTIILGILGHMLAIIALAASTVTSGFTHGVGQVILLDDVQCVGNESRLIDCLARPLGQHNCAFAEDVGVRCEGIIMYGHRY